MSDPRAQVSRALAASLHSSVLFRLDPALLAEPCELGTGDGDGRGPTLRPDGYGLAAVLDHMLGTDRAAFGELERELHDAAPLVEAVQLRTATIHRMDQPAAAGKAISFKLRTGAEIPAALASDGVRLFLAYLALIHSSAAPSVLLLEEPENGVHPRQLPRIAEYLGRLTAADRGARRSQVILATHSPYLLDHLPREQVLVFGRKPTGETVVRKLTELPAVQARIDSGLSLGEMWFNTGEDALLGDAEKG